MVAVPFKRHPSHCEVAPQVPHDRDLQFAQVHAGMYKICSTHFFVHSCTDLHSSRCSQARWVHLVARLGGVDGRLRSLCVQVRHADIVETS